MKRLLMIALLGSAIAPTAHAISWSFSKSEARLGNGIKAAALWALAANFAYYRLYNTSQFGMAKNNIMGGNMNGIALQTSSAVTLWFLINQARYYTHKAQN